MLSRFYTLDAINFFAMAYFYSVLGILPRLLHVGSTPVINIISWEHMNTYQRKNVEGK